MQCSLCKTTSEEKIKKGGICISCGRFFCIDCIYLIENEGIKEIICKFCKNSKTKKIPFPIFFYPLISYLFFFLFYHFIHDYVGKNLLIFFSLPLISIIPFYLDFKIRYPFNPSLLLYLFLYLISLIPWLFSTINLIRLY